MSEDAEDAEEMRCFPCGEGYELLGMEADEPEDEEEKEDVDAEQEHRWREEQFAGARASREDHRSVGVDQDARDSDGEAEAINEEGGEDVAEDVKLRPVRELHEPTLAVRQAHERAGHIPHRPWCRACVRARKPNQAHHLVMRARGQTPEVHGDYCFFRDRPGETSMPVLVLKDRDSLATAAHVVSTRADNTWVTRQTCRDLKRWGILNDVIFAAIRNGC